ncbi:MAG: DUF1883 domain-containing protein [Acidimicrobiia bacterium]
MEQRYWDLDHQTTGRSVRVRFSGTAANVRLLDQANFDSFKGGRQHSFVGGHVRRSPVMFRIPRDDHWYVTVDHDDPACAGASVQVLPEESPGPARMGR